MFELLMSLSSILFAGFPGESDDAHRELVDFLQEFRFERAGAFAFSEEDGTPAAELPGQIPPRIRCEWRPPEGAGTGPCMVVTVILLMYCCTRHAVHEQLPPACTMTGAS
jgi:hypothetical protein